MPTPNPTPLDNLIYALHQHSPLGHWSDGAQAADTITHLATLLDGVMADDPQAIRDAAAWLADNRPEGVAGGDSVGEGEG